MGVRTMPNKKQNVDRAARMCPVCGEDSRVYDTRETADGTIRRKRRCLTCGAYFITAESFVGMVRLKQSPHSRA